ncbi:SMP-30/gluconolactonase/LRE family protein [Pseudidiomarina terrestris]|uniref:SMP-30/gluconolactonase/LRE family protein n=1 Tax=Pseudidiomarina terrestris TaxID=2820060 RepID=UPI002655D7B5|nr:MULTISPECIES: SMP-30/gluconolactonase/LRE family protein [unclassified Pseudidiomarina]MDN7125980.1 SMP-30/gluconolactonase/LRE family protein [Pseudidiomarina sp. 1APR75-33.1]MDN7135935.1 SMP-30/gluconolactonase/LRE family protein [Pseudidiomarina sp. 1ASP75-5]MEA3588100.1 SMP-30/gluconolactonase/LRE family protein [Pseudidiomarina sp. 1APP75-27a]
MTNTPGPGYVFKRFLLLAVLLFAAYLLLWPVTIEPRSWNAPRDRGYVGAYTVNHALQQLERISLPNSVGPEDIAIDAEGRPVFGVLSGDILRLEADGSFTTLTTTGGRPLGLEFDQQGGLWIADAYQGLMYWSPESGLELLVTQVDGVPVRYADDVDVAANGTVYFSDASTRFAADSLGTYAASLLDIMEHGGNGRLLAFEPDSGHTYTVQGGLHFANGVAVSHDQQWVMVVETGSYRILKIGIGERNNGEVITLMDNLPGFPDNINDAPDGLFWVGLVSPRNSMLDALSDYPLVRKMIQRLPAFMRPAAERYGHLIAIDSNGSVVRNLQDPEGGFGQITGAAANDTYIYVSSLHENALARLKR